MVSNNCNIISIDLSHENGFLKLNNKTNTKDRIQILMALILENTYEYLLQLKRRYDYETS